MHKLCRLKGDEIKALVPVIKSQEYAEYARSHSKEDVETYLIGELALYKERKTIEERRYLFNKDFLESIAKEQRTETVQKNSTSLKDSVKNWLHPNREKVADKPEEIGE